MKLNKKDYRRIGQLNREGFGADDAYSSKGVIRDYVEGCPESAGLIVTRIKGDIMGFLMWYINNGAINTGRRAVDKKCRGLGLGVKLTQKVIDLGYKMGYHYDTYCDIWNLASINSNIKCGCFVTKIGVEWISLSTKRRGK